jgi:hypothetical protein
MDGRFVRLEYSSVFFGKPLTIVRYMGFDRLRGKYIELQFESAHTDVMQTQGDIQQFYHENTEEAKMITLVHRRK